MNNIIEDLKKYLIEKYECHSIILYGSFADGTYTDESDIDIICFTDYSKYKNDTSIFKNRKLDVWIYDTKVMENYEKLIHIEDGKVLLDERNLCDNLLKGVYNIISNDKTISKEEIIFQKNWLLKMLNR